MNKTISFPKAPPPVGSLAWERAGGPPLSFRQRLNLMGGAAAVILGDLEPQLRMLFGRLGLLSVHWPEKVDLAVWAPPDSRIAHEAEEYLREVSTRQMVDHSFRTYYFSAILYELSGLKQSIDREALYVAALLHDVGLFEVSRPLCEHCFSVGSAREARRIAKGAGWDEVRQDRVAVAITTNLNPFVPLDTYGPEAHFMRMGGMVEVTAQEWKVNPENVNEILERHPRDGFAADALEHVRLEEKQNPGCRFACLEPVFPVMVRHSVFHKWATKTGCNEAHIE